MLGGVLGVVIVLRCLALPTDFTTPSFGHDSAYIARLAENLLAGKGYVNDAHWLVFLQPDRLPMPYHNANPLYPTLIAGVSWLTGVSVITAGYAINVVAHALLVVLVVLLLQPWVPSFGMRGLAGVAVACFPPILVDSLTYLPDLSSLVLLLAALVCLVRIGSVWAAVPAGLFLGLAWLSRSSATLAVPMIGVYLLGRYGWWKGLGRCVILGIAALVTVSPWLVHTYRVWGNPLRSDAAYYGLQDYHARSFEDSVDRYWHSTDVPASLGTLLGREPVAVLRFYVGCLPLMARQTVAGWSESQFWLAGLLGLLGLAAVVRLRHEWKPEWTLPILAGLVYAACAFFLFAPRARTLEIRYLALLSVFFALLLVFGVVRAVQGWNAVPPGLRWGNRFVVVLGLIFWLGWVPWHGVQTGRRLWTPEAERVAYLHLARSMDRELSRSEPVVVGQFPYLYNLATDAPALSIPQSDDLWLRDYMKRYHARFVLLTPSEREFWRPAWAENPPAGFVRRTLSGASGAVVFERKDAP